MYSHYYAGWHTVCSSFDNKYAYKIRTLIKHMYFVINLQPKPQTHKCKSCINSILACVYKNKIIMIMILQCEPELIIS